ncbi:uncharacterized protein LOC100278265 [Zea mays]|uniref:Universal stress protein family protein n=1 Tax=Zea mays TaxID=4577 RepID=B6TLF8_MAIZE|nr:uncharacterized protein LOC100278265 [Zea mays]ACG37941.1 universal stress protein family protein [Zea mays]AQK39934.1 Universal stress protein family protein [Zea mays]|eukprot:NP_001281181.1 uncharacterized protein LOC100278265 [Zea mays]
MSRPLSSFCLHRIRSGGTASTAAPPSICANKDDGGGGGGGESRSLKDGKQKDEWEEANEKGSAEAVVVGRKVMVAAADGGGEEARTALQWALSHAVRPCDTVVLLDVASGKNRRDPRGSPHLEALRSICQAKRPEVCVELSLAEGGKDRGPAIVEAARKQGVSLLVVGQKKRSVTWRLLSMWIAGVKGGGGGGYTSAADYCVQHAACMALAVRRKSRRGGGYLITTRRQRDFWLLA